MTAGVFITATGTDVGKTYISGLIVKRMCDMGKNCGYYKPALSGAEIVNNKLRPGDCEFVLKMAKLDINPLDCVSYVFKTAVSPHLAAEIAGETIQLEKIKNDFLNLKKNFDYIVVEGAGGIVCPLNVKDNLLLPDVIKALGIDIVIVASAELGTINSTVLTVEFAKQHGIKIRGIILNKYNEKDFMHSDNKKLIEKLTGIQVIATVAANDENIEIEKLEEIFKEV